MKSVVLFFTIAGTAVANTAIGEVYFRKLEDLNGGFSSRPQAVSYDGSVVVGMSDFGTHMIATRWVGSKVSKIGTLAPPGVFVSSIATGVSGDGDTAVGFSDTADSDRTAGFRWTKVGGIARLPRTESTGSMYQVSSDSSTIVGMFWPGDGSSKTYPSRWRASTGVQTLPGLEDRIGESTGVSMDGNRIVGRVNIPNTTDAEAFVWEEESGATILPKLNSSLRPSDAMNISGDGNTAVGFCAVSVLRSTATRWTRLPDQSWRVEDLGVLSGGTHSFATAVSQNGTLAVGATQMPDFSEVGCVWETGRSPTTLNEYAARFGVDLRGWTFQRITDVSDDGSTLVTYGSDPNGQYFGIVFHIPTPASSAVFLAALSFVSRQRRGASSDVPLSVSERTVSSQR